MRIKITSSSLKDTEKIGNIIAKHAFKGMVITLNGDLGAGKTTLTKSIGAGLGIKEEINSPTFNILKCYFNKPLPLYHIDAYRLEGVNEENLQIGLEEVIEGDGVAIIERSHFIDQFIPSIHLDINIKTVENEIREFDVSSNNPKFDALIEELKEKM